MTQGPFQVIAAVTGSDGIDGSASTSVTVEDVPPTVSDLALSRGTINEGGTVTLTGAVTDPGVLDNETVEVTWGDGSTSPAAINETTRLFSASHTYLSNPAGEPTGGSFPITATATATDDVGETGSAATSVIVDNVPPSVIGLMLNSGTVNAGQPLTITGTVTDPGVLDTEAVVVSWGDETTSVATVDQTTRTFSAIHTFASTSSGAAPVTFPIVATATDSDGGTGSAGTSVVVDNVAPTLTGLAFTPSSINEGGSTTLSATIGGDASDADLVAITWGDRTTTSQVIAAAATSFSIAHVYADNPAGQPVGAFTASATVTDVANTLSVNGSAAVTAANVAPAITSFTNSSSATSKVPSGLPVGFNLTFTDPGVLDTHTVIIGWGDGIRATTYNLAAGVLSTELSHTYTKPGTYYVTVQVEDKDGGVSGGKATFAYVGAALQGQAMVAEVTAASLIGAQITPASSPAAAPVASTVAAGGGSPGGRRDLVLRRRHRGTVDDERHRAGHEHRPTDPSDGLGRRSHHLVAAGLAW